jgi:hypothetical protein
MSWTNAELYALAKHNEVCAKWFHGKKCVEAGLVDITFFELIKGEK